MDQYQYQQFINLIPSGYLREDRYNCICTWDWVDIEITMFFHLPAVSVHITITGKSGFSIGISLPLYTPSWILENLREVIFNYSKVVSDTYLTELIVIARPFISATGITCHRTITLPTVYFSSTAAEFCREEYFFLSITYEG